MAAVEYRMRDGVAVFALNNPPVNGLGAAVRAELADALDKGLSDPGVAAFVLIGAGRMFSAGADIREFGQPPADGVPHLPDLIDRIEAANKPVVAAIHGVAAGGGLELALGCHVRLADPGARVGLPEVTLGIVPGAGGTQRMPRLAGVAEALDLILSGTLVPAAKAQALGILDELADGDLETAAVAAARKAADRLPPRRTRDLDDKLEAARAAPALFDEFRTRIARRARGMRAPYAAIDCVEAAVALPFDEGLARERETFRTLVGGDEARAMRHAFFAEREVRKIPDVPPDTPATAIDRAAVIGCGTMGGGIAMNFANAGIPVTVLETDDEALERGLETVRRNYAGTVSKGRLSQQQMDERLAAITGTTDFDAVADADIVIEAVFEEMDLKQEVFRRLDGVCKPGAILASNTSMLDIDRIAAVTARPEAVIGTHFFSPANVMRLMENVRGAATSHQTIATVMDLSARLGKIGVLVGICDGFVGNRMLGPYTREARFLLEEGCLPQEVDKAIYDFGFPMGPFAMGDLAGLDVSWRIRKRQRAERPSNLRYSHIADRLCERGRFGQKTGAGWYRYEPGSRTPIPDPEVEEVILQASRDAGIERRAFTAEEIVARCLYPLINEGARILEEGIAIRPGDVDVVWMNGYGFPRWRGGPMFYADTVGVDRVYEKMAAFHAQHGELMEPAPLLERLAKEGGTFGGLSGGSHGV